MAPFFRSIDVHVAGIWIGAGYALEATQVWREDKKVWAYNKDFYQRALLRRDWYLHREEETVSMSE